MQQSYELGTYAKNPYAAGQQRYGLSATSTPNGGRTANKEGYIDRERRNKMKRNVYLRWMQDNSQGAYGTSNAMRRGK